MPVKDQNTFIMIFANIKKGMKIETFTIISFDLKIPINKTLIKINSTNHLKGSKKLNQAFIKNFQVKCFLSFNIMTLKIPQIIQVFQTFRWSPLKTNMILSKIMKNKSKY